MSLTNDLTNLANIASVVITGVISNGTNITRISVGNATINTAVNATTISTGNSTVNSSINATAVYVYANATNYVAVNATTISTGNATINTTINATSVIVNSIVANGGIGANGQVLTSNGTGMAWANAATGGLSQGQVLQLVSLRL